ncbi:uncharacterized protein LOC120358069 isoform X2 [Solenopsis invicta]|uniref:uncharacterized protein LOC120358069 isoform X2 n=1 Tax=Solenopsis invicta TaxID=13686 RepID=UPI00193CF7BA|nr:uncharacterized protein LOC120358069 isoform X2 [Solenopsis invicta]
MESPRQGQHKEHKDVSVAFKSGHQLHLAHAEALTSPNGRTPSISKNGAALHSIPERDYTDKKTHDHTQDSTLKWI